MGLAKETLCPVICELTFVHKTNTDDGNGLMLYFQSPEYIAEYGIELAVEHLLSNKSEEEKSRFLGNIKFTISKEQLDIPINQKLTNCQLGKQYIIKFGISPQMMATSSGTVKYAKTKPIEVFEDWTEYVKELKNKGLIKFNSTATAGAAS